MAAELSSADAGDRLVSAVVEAAGSIDIVVNNAGVALDNFIANLTAPFAIIRAATRVFKTQGTGGVIINLTSTSGERGNAGQSAYAASKGGLHAVTQTAARELGRYGVRVNSISPVAATTMNGLVDPERRAAVSKSLPLGSVADPSHVAEAVAFLVSDRAAFITGELIHVDAGAHLS
jgi:3-oxoacyl-[acyl-carrier protein] reductase